MKLSFKYIHLLSLAYFYSCKSAEHSERASGKEIILHAGREAPLGWLHLELFSDSTFIATNAGLRDADKYQGTFKLHYDTLFLAYRDSIPKTIGKEMLIGEDHLSFLDVPGGMPITRTSIDYKKLIEHKPVDSLKITELALMQGVWQHSQDEKAVISIRQNFWSGYYDQQPLIETADYRLHWQRQLPRYADTGVNSSFLVLTNKTDTLNYEVLGMTDSTLSLMHFPSGRIHLYRKKK